MSEPLTLKPASLAIISGGGDDISIRLASYISSEIATRSIFKVIDQETISRRLSRYPVNLTRVDASSDKKPVWLSPQDKKRLDAMQASLKADYLFVVWVDDFSSVSTNGNVKYYVTTLGNLYEYPKGRAVAFTYDENSKGMSPLAIFREKGYDVDVLLKDSARKVADEFIKVVGMAK